MVIQTNPPPCLWHQVRVHRVLSAPAGSDPAGLGGNPASPPTFAAWLAWPCSSCMPFFSLIFRFVFGLVFCRSLEASWTHFGSHFGSIFCLKFRLIFGLIFWAFFYCCFNDFVSMFDSKIHPKTYQNIIGPNSKKLVFASKVVQKSRLWKPRTFPKQH